MALLIVAPKKDVTEWVEGVREASRDIDVRVWPASGDPDDIEVALVWNHPEGSLTQFRNLQLISSMGAGIDHVLKDQQLPKNVPVTRVVGESLTTNMSNYIMMAVLQYHKRFLKYLSDKENKQWNQNHAPEIPVSIGILGLGVLGQDVAKKLSDLGFNVCGYSNSRKELPGVRSYAGDEELDEFLSHVNILVCLLPLTSKTENFLNLDLFKKMKKGSYLINVARGNHLVEEDLLEALRLKMLSGAFLDVFRKEPLPRNHPFWEHPDIMMTPHIASITNIEDAIPLIVENYNRVIKGKPLLNEVDMKREY